MTVRPDLIASRFNGLPVGPRLLYSFETQTGIPVDQGSQLLRDLSPFTLRLVVPSLLETVSSTGVDVNIIGRASSSQADNQAAADAVRSLFGISNITGSDQARLAGLQQIVSAGQVMSTATSAIERAVLVDVSTAADIAFQVEQMLQVPPLTLLINPSQFQRTYGTVQNYTNRTRKGFIFERWGETQVTMSFSGSTGAFIAGVSPTSGTAPNATETPSVSGLQYASRRDSAAYQNFISLMQFFNNNGYVYDTVNGTEAHLMIGAVAIDYDQVTYVGHIDSLDYSFSDQSPHRVEWSMEFTADQIFDEAQASIVVQPMIAPQPNPAYPGRTQSFVERPDGLAGGSFIQTSGTEQFQSQTPLELFIP